MEITDLLRTFTAFDVTEAAIRRVHRDCEVPAMVVDPLSWPWRFNQMPREVVAAIASLMQMRIPITL